MSVVARTQEERRAETRSRLLDAAAALFAEHGIDGASVDAIADAADRTSGALYDHFGSKDGLLTALLDGWLSDVAAAILVEFVTAPTLDERLDALWGNVAQPPPEASRWVQLEHELWLYATRHTEVGERVAGRYRDAARALSEAVTTWAEIGDVDPPVTVDQIGPLVIGLLIGLEMQHRLDPETVSPGLARAGLRALLGADATAPAPARTSRRRKR